MKLDEPFEPLSLDLAGSSVPPETGIPTCTALAGPCGRQELVDPAWLEEKTVVMDREELMKLVEAELLVHRLTRELHTRPTVRSMEAVVPPSRRPPPESLVTVVEAPPLREGTG